MIVQYSFAPIHKNNLAHIGVYEYLLKLIEGDENISRWTMENVVILKNQNSNNYKTKGQKMKVNFKNTMELSEEAINEVVTSEEGLYLMHEQNYSKSMLLAKNVTDLMDEYNTYQTLAEYATSMRLSFNAFDNTPFHDMREVAKKLADAVDEAVLLQKEQLGADTGAHEYITKELIKIEAKSSLRTAVEYASTDEDYTDCAVALQDFDSELDMEFMLDVLDEINSRSSSKSINSYLEQIRTALRIVEMASNNEQLAS